MKAAGPGTVYLVGAGPGAPGLITLDGVRCLRKADVVIYDYLAHPSLLDHAPPEAERVLVGKHGGGRHVAQETITALLLDRAARGMTVVRLKGGDPFLFGRGAEEGEALAAAGIPFEVVPGVTSAVAVPAYAGIPLTHRDLASSVTVVTGYEDPRKPEDAVRWDAVARRGGTLVILMTALQLRANMTRLLANGMAPETPVAVIRCGTLADQEKVVGTVADIADCCEERGLGPPALAVVGDVVRLHERLDWYERKPLFGRRVVVTRPRRQAAAFVDLLAAAGAEVISSPAIEIVPPESWEPLDEAIREVERYDWLVFTSVNGVEMFFSRLRELKSDFRALHGARLAAVGPQTARALDARGLLVDVVPEEFRAEAVAEAMRAQGIQGARILLPRAAVAREVLPEMLAAFGAEVDEVAGYRSVPAGADAGPVRGLLEASRVDLVTFTSSSTVLNFLASLGEDAVALMRRTAIGCIGPITAGTAREAGLKVAIQPSDYTVPAFAEAIIAHFAEGERSAKQ